MKCAKSLHDALAHNERLGQESRWLISEDDAAAIETLHTLETAAGRIPDGKRRKLLESIRKGDEAHAIASIRELVTFEWLFRLGMKPVFQPDAYAPLTPDLAFECGKRRFLADVFVVFNPSRTVWLKTENSLGTTDAGDRAKKIADRLVEKFVKYGTAKDSVMFFVFHGDHIVEARNVEQALYGAAMGDPHLEEDFPEAITSLCPPGGFFLPDELGNTHARVSAVAWCDWFYSQNRASPGKRLHTIVYHHWHPEIPIEAGAFEPFPELAWSKDSDEWKPHLTASPNIVSRFAQDGLESREYTSNEPW